MSKQTARVLVLGLAFIFALSFVPTAVFAHEGHSHDDTEEATTISAEEKEGTRGERLKTRIQDLKQERQEKKQERLADAKLKVCEQRKAKITSIINRSVTRAERQLELFTTISERVKKFYVDKGYTLSDYEELVAAVDAAKAEAEANLAVVKGLDGFDCSAEDPKGNAEAFKLALKSVNEDLKQYRTAVKNLIVGVKSANNNGSENEGGTQ